MQYLDETNYKCYMKKNRYFIQINSAYGQSYRFSYNYGATKNIMLRVGMSFAEIRVNLSKLFTSEEILSSNTYLFPDAIRKALLLQMVLFSNSMNIRKIKITINGNTESFNYTPDYHSPVYQLISGPLKTSIPGTWSQGSVIDYILSNPKSNYDMRTAALFSYILSKSKKYESERFVNLWMAFNGMYGYIDSLVPLRKGKRKEYEQIVLLMKVYRLGKETLTSTDNNSVGQEVCKILRHTDAVDFIAHPSKDNIPNDFADNIRNCLNKGGQVIGAYDISAYGYLLTQFSYYFRCNIFHADKPLDLISYKDDHNLNCLRIINGLLEEFLDEHLPDIFDNQIIQKLLNDADFTYSNETV